MKDASMKKRFRCRAPWLAILTLTLLSAPAFAQVPQGMTFTGRAVDQSGNPLAGPVNLELRVFDAETGGSQLYSEEHLGVPLDATGDFSVQLGLGASPSGPFDADLFSQVDRWLEVEVDGELLTPRQIIGSVPRAPLAEQVDEIVPAPNDARFEDCGDGTVADHKTGLQWEKKTGTLGSAVFCETETCPNPHDVNNRYAWSNTGTDPDGGAFTDFLTSLNSGVVVTTSDEARGDPAAEPKAFGSGWRLPTIGELRTILIGPEAAPGQAKTCPAAPCIDPGLAAVGGPTAPSNYWSASAYAGGPGGAWFAYFRFGTVDGSRKTRGFYVRAVRTGSCD
jgi:hypothetical protein